MSDVGDTRAGSVERVCIVGGGVIGSLFAGHLARVCEVSVLTRRREHADALNRDGLMVTGKSDFHVRVTATDDPDPLEPFDVAIVATKASGLEAAATSLEGRFPDATIVTVLNGIGAEEVVRRHGDWLIVSGVTFMSGTRHSDTHVEYILDTETWLGPYEDTPFDVVEDIARTIVASGLHAEALPDLRPLVGGTVRLPAARDIISWRRAGSPLTSISTKACPLRSRSRLAAWQKPQNGVV